VSPGDIRNLEPTELAAAAAVLGRAMRDNPLHAAAFGPDPDRREQALTRMFEPVLRHIARKGAVLGAFTGGSLVGVTGMAPPGRCAPTSGEKLDVLRAVVVGAGLTATLRLIQWVGVWSRQDPKKEPHWHAGPVGVERRLQGRGLGSVLMRVFCERMDAAGSVSYLETDREINVRFYERFGFRVTGQRRVLGVPNWFMVRSPSAAP
jgi:ribosomal protein S18 acetylase RimI-like enzyme